MDTYNTLVKPFLDYFDEGRFFDNDFAVAGVMTALVTTLIYQIRKFPIFVWSRMKRHLYYSVTVEQDDELYNLVCEYLENNYPNKTRRAQATTKNTKGGGRKSRRIEEPSLVSEAVNEGDKGMNGVEPSVHYHNLSDTFWIAKRGLVVSHNREKLDNAREHDMVFFNKISIKGIFAKNRIKKFIDGCYALRPKKKTEYVKEYYIGNEYGDWSIKDSGVDTILKTVDNMHFPEKERIIERIDQFTTQKERYRKSCIQWKFGLLLHGKAGSGKTSFARSLAKYTQRELYVMNLASIKEKAFEYAFAYMSSNSILLLDDVDICLNGRDDADNQLVKLSTLLSYMDGNNSRDDIIIVLTTNNISKLDDALIRKGRVDLIEEVSYPDEQSINTFLNYFYDTTGLSVKSGGVIDFSMVEIQSICLEELDENVAVERVNNLMTPTQ